jgi:ATP-dependent RNA helicase RhlE
MVLNPSLLHEAVQINQNLGVLLYQNSSLPGGSRRGRGGARPMYSSRNQSPRKNPGANIDTRRFVNQAAPMAEEIPFVPEHKFVDFGFDAALQRNIDGHGYITTTPIQDGAIKPAMEGRDLIGLANTGTGKTAAFLLPIIHRMLTRQVRRALILAPTRELASQIEDEFRIFGRGLGLYSTLVVGGASMNRQLQQIARKPHFIIATPGRLKDLLNNYNLKLDEFDVLVLDEADRMVDMGFIKDIREILTYLPAKKQSLFLSATITPDVEGLIAALLHDPVTVSVRKGETAAHVNQNIVEVDGKDAKIAKLVELLRQPDFSKVLIFGETKHGVQKLSDLLNAQGLRTAAIHGNKSQPQRQRALNDFKNEHVQALIATDVAARGLDIPAVSHVINFDVPHTYEDYVHRIGRTGRAGLAGEAITFVPSRGNFAAPQYSGRR